MEVNENYISKTVEKALMILNLFKDHKKLSFTMIQEYLEMNKSTLYRLLYTLEHHSYLHKDEYGRYELGVNAFVLGNSYTKENQIWKVVSPYLKEISNKYELTSHLGVLENNKVIILEKENPPDRTIKMYSRVGSEVPIHCTGQGKVLLAFSPEDITKNIVEGNELEPYTSNTITNTEYLYKELKQIKKQGYAVDDSEHQKHIKCVAVPILNSNKIVIAALSVTGLSQELNNEEKIMKIVAFLKQVAEDIKIKLGL